MKSTGKRKTGLIALVIIIIFFIAAFTAAVVYINDYYHADMTKINDFLPSDAEYTEKDNKIIFEPEGASSAIIFYPGGKVENKAYIPLMYACAEKGILCVIVKMPFNLAVFDIDAADGVKEEFPEIESWYIAGHSLGGSMAASYIKNHSEDFDGLILLGAYSTTDLSSTALSVLSIYGSEDKIMNMDKYTSSLSNLPGGYTEKIISGGCHAYFGMYGEQEGDGSPTITAKEQILITADYIAEFVFSDK